MFRVRMGLVIWAIATLGTVQAKEPNVLLVLTDDQRADTIRALGNPEITTHALDALVERGFVFSNAYCQGSTMPAVCAPSRTMLLTGRSLYRMPAPNAKTYAGPTLGGSFSQAGYDTICISKPGNSFRVGHDAFAKTVHIPHVGAATNQKCFDAAIEFVNEYKGEKPFFVYLAPSMPHDPRTAEPEFHKMYDPAKITLSKNFMPKHPFDNGELMIRDEKLANFPRTPEEMRKHLAEYYACVSSLDHHFNRLVQTLQKKGQLEKTLIVFTSDQGLAVGGRHGLMGKQNLYEHVKPPLIFAGPGIPKGKSDALVYLFDLFPTLCDFTGQEIPKSLEGASLKPVIQGKQAKVREHLFGAYKDVQRMVRDKQWKLMWYPKVERFQLFDLSTDPDELNDLSSKPEHAERLSMMKKLLAAQQEAWADKAPRPQ